ncbi:MAG: lipopolysaccharide biosynthesis protein [Thermoplasmata archaeon]
MASDLVKDVMEDIRSPLYRNAIYLILNTLMAAGAGFVFWLLVARVSGSPEAVGQALLLVGVLALLATVSQLGFGIGLIRFLPGSRGEGRGRMMNSALTVSVLVAVGLAFLVLLTMDLWFPQGADVLSLVALVPIFLLLAVFGTSAPIVDNSFVAGRKASYVVMRSSLYQAVRLATPLLLIGLLGVLGVLASLMVAHVLALAVAFFLLLPRLYPGFRLMPVVDKGALGDMLHFSLGNHVAEIFHVLPYPVILVIVTRLTGSLEQAAFFGVPWLIASLLFAVPLMASVSLYAEGSHFADRLRGDLRRTLRFVLPVLVAGIAFVWFFGAWVLSLFGPAYPAEGVQLLRVLAISGIFVTVNGLFIAVARVMKWVKAVIALWAYVATGTIALSYLLLPVYGLVGVGYAWLLTNGTAALAVMGAYLLKRGTLRALLTATPKG